MSGLLSRNVLKKLTLEFRHFANCFFFSSAKSSTKIYKTWLLSSQISGVSLNFKFHIAKRFLSLSVGDRESEAGVPPRKRARPGGDLGARRFAWEKPKLLDLTVQRSALCRSRRELSNEYLLAQFGFDTAEDEP